MGPIGDGLRGAGSQKNKNKKKINQLCTKPTQGCPDGI
jgi:hypothetical protein